MASKGNCIRRSPLGGARTFLLSALVLSFQSPPSLHGQTQEAPKQAGANPPAMLTGFAVKGTSQARVTIVEFSDFACPFCGRVAPVVEELLHAYPDEIQFVFKHNPLPIHADAALAHEAALAAGAQGKFWEMHDLLLANQGRLKLSDLTEYAKQLNLDLDSFVFALDRRLYRPWVEHDQMEARGLGVNATPTFFINGRRLVGAQTFAALKALVDQQLGRGERGAGTGAAVDLRQLKLDLAPVRGAATAPVTIVEFTDFQCPFCARVLPTLEALSREYPGRLKWVLKNFPLDFHPDAALAHEAALAAGAQGKFWEMHDRIFANQGAMKREDLERSARGLGLDVARFVADLDSRRFKAMVDADKEEAARLGVSGTPTFFINGKRLVGAQPPEAFQKIIEEELKAVAGETKPAAGKGLDVEVSKGPSQAPVTIIYFTDLQSKLTAQAAAILKQLTNAYPEQVRLVFKHLPLEFHAEATLAHEAALAAGAQGKFWEMHDVIAANPQALSKADLIRYAERLGLAREPFVTALEARSYRGVVQQDLAEAKKRDVRGAPTFFINRKRLDGLKSLEVFQAIIEAELRQRRSGSD